MALTAHFINRIGNEEKTVSQRECGATALVACLEALSSPSMIRYNKKITHPNHCFHRIRHADTSSCSHRKCRHVLRWVHRKTGIQADQKRVCHYLHNLQNHAVSDNATAYSSGGPLTFYRSPSDQVSRQFVNKDSSDLLPKQVPASSSVAFPRTVSACLVSSSAVVPATFLPLSMSRRRLATNIPALDGHLALPPVPSFRTSVIDAPFRITSPILPETPYLRPLNPLVLPSPPRIAGDLTLRPLPVTPEGQIAHTPRYPPPRCTPVLSDFRRTLKLPWQTTEGVIQAGNSGAVSQHLPFTPDNPSLITAPFDMAGSTLDISRLTKRFQGLRTQGTSEARAPTVTQGVAGATFPLFRTPRNPRVQLLRSQSCEVVSSVASTRQPPAISRTGSAMNIALRSPLIISSPSFNKRLVPSLFSSPATSPAIVSTTGPRSYFCL